MHAGDEAFFLRGFCYFSNFCDLVAQSLCVTTGTCHHPGARLQADASRKRRCTTARSARQASTQEPLRHSPNPSSPCWLRPSSHSRCCGPACPRPGLSPPNQTCCSWWWMVRPPLLWPDVAVGATADLGTTCGIGISGDEVSQCTRTPRALCLLHRSEPEPQHIRAPGDHAQHRASRRRFDAVPARLRLDRGLVSPAPPGVTSGAHLCARAVIGVAPVACLNAPQLSAVAHLAPAAVNLNSTVMQVRRAAPRSSPASGPTRLKCGRLGRTLETPAVVRACRW